MPSSDQIIATARLDLVLFTPALLEAVLSGRVTAIAGVELPPGWIRRSERVLRRRLDQVVADPGSGPWLLRAMVHRDDRELVGRIGFHGKPGANGLGAGGAVELGYTVEPAFRRQGFAEEAVLGMMAWARMRSVDHYILSIGPTNAPSLGLAAKLGFAEVARVMDEEDGPEIVFELRGSVSTTPAGVSDSAGAAPERRS
ncbi:MAG TPA: GNAT family protein [Candidatus Saccharimonadales bacterium]|nr:GNAT family protein [Candidatus Saccharimonadales bacterium]